MEKEATKKDLQRLEAISSSSMVEKEEETDEFQEELVDRLSSLPNEILRHILSFLDTKVAVQTSVLSKRWRYIWIGLSIVRFRLDSFDDSTSFKYFVKHVLLHRDESKTLVKIICYFDLYDFDGLDMVAFATVLSYLEFYGHSVQNLIIGDCNLEMLPPFLPQVFAWKSLRTLKLDRVRIPNNTQFDLVSLTTLHLIQCIITWDDGETYDPFGVCSRLETLHLASCVWFSSVENQEKKIVISAPELKNLKIIRYCYDDSILSELKMVISSPKLTSLSFEGLKIFDCSIACLPLLEKVEVDIGHNTTVPNSSEDHQRLINLFRAVGHAKFVTLSLDTVDVLSEFTDVLAGQPSPFNGVKLFKIRVRPDSFSSSTSPYSITLPSSVMNYLLNASPSAEAIKVEYVDKKELDPRLNGSDSDGN